MKKRGASIVHVLVALLVFLGVDLIVIVVLLGIGWARRRWISRQPGSFKGAIRLGGGEPDSKAKWQRGRGRWVRDVLVWSKAPLLLRSTLVAVDGLAGEARIAGAGEVKRLGSNPVIVPMVAEGGESLDVAVAEVDRDRAFGPTRRDPPKTQGRVTSPAHQVSTAGGDGATATTNQGGTSDD